MLPCSDDRNLLRETLSNRNCANTNVLMLSVLDERKRAFKEGADGFISKPLDCDHLLQMIAEVFPRTTSNATNPATAFSSLINNHAFKKNSTKPGVKVFFRFHGMMNGSIAHDPARLIYHG